MSIIAKYEKYVAECEARGAGPLAYAQWYESIYKRMN